LGQTAAQPVATYATYLLPSGAEQNLILRGAPTRVEFDPGAFDALRDFLVRALNTLFSGGDHLLFLACVLLPAWRPREAATLFGAAVLGQGATMTASLLFQVPEPVVLSFRMIATSAIAIAGILAVVGARLRWTLPVAVVFGLASGFVLGATLTSAEPFAGSQLWIAAATYILTVLTGLLWLGAVAWLARDWLDRAGAFPRFVMLFVAVVLIHTALHRMTAAGRELTAITVEASTLAVWLTLGWTAAFLLAGLINGSRAQVTGGSLRTAQEGEA
jgi:hypothetical protein